MPLVRLGRRRLDCQWPHQHIKQANVLATYPGAAEMINLLIAAGTILGTFLGTLTAIGLFLLILINAGVL